MKTYSADILNPDEPHDLPVDQAQCQSIIQLVHGQKSGCKVLELGSGGGRIVKVFLESGAHVSAVDHDLDSLKNIKKKFIGFESQLKTYSFDFFETGLDVIKNENGFNIISLLGNTMMECLNVSSMARLFRDVFELLLPDGIFIIDDLPSIFWPSIIEGDWQNGISEQDDLRMSWDLRDPIFVLRSGESLQDDAPPRPFERKFRLWTSGEIELLSWSSGLQGPRVGAGVLIMKRGSA